MSIMLGDGDDRRDPLSFVYNRIMEASSILENINVCGHHWYQRRFLCCNFK